MNNFWKNIIKYPRFLLSSILGILLIMIVPFKNLLKGKNSLLILALLSLIIISLDFILKNMLVISFLVV